MRNLLILAIVGFAAQLIDGSLGMAYGVTASSLLLAAGTAPAAASAVVHLAEVGTSLFSGAAHWKFGNVDWKVVGIMALPGAIGAFLGATLLTSLPADLTKPFVALFLLSLGVYVMYRFLRLKGARPQLKPRPSAKFLAPLGLVAGTMDAIGGGGWGPIGTSSLLSSGRMEARKVVGTIDTSEFAVSIAASAGFLLGLGSAGIDWTTALALLAGGAVAAPIAAWIVKHLAATILGVAAGGWIVLTNSMTVIESWSTLDKASVWLWLIMAVLVVAWLLLIGWTIKKHRAAKKPIGREGELTRA
ncbi:sulfite exporter TauE/SafE family protein [Arthrobacter castelli]|uniref:sulfite exporter TauE/SafE family protein n=1 Tax=Arthrobacter castelli TaxID=271431 RepID=UPI000428CFC1|nr:sulfite exporter TauE/SafE family protein [Arthrobacter castelli]